jgi:hypothetical protein
LSAGTDRGVLGSPSRAPVNALTAAILVIAALLIGWSRRS